MISVYSFVTCFKAITQVSNNRYSILQFQYEYPLLETKCHSGDDIMHFTKIFL